MSFRLADLPKELVAEIAHHLNDSSFTNLSQTCRELHGLFNLERQNRAAQLALAPRHLYEQQYVYADDQEEGIDTPLLVFDRPLF